MPIAIPNPIFIGPHGSPLCFAILAGFFDSMTCSTCLLSMVAWVGASGSAHPKAVAKRSQNQAKTKTEI